MYRFSGCVCRILTAKYEKRTPKNVNGKLIRAIQSRNAHKIIINV